MCLCLNISKLTKLFYYFTLWIFFILLPANNFSQEIFLVTFLECSFVNFIEFDIKSIDTLINWDQIESIFISP